MPKKKLYRNLKKTKRPELTRYMAIGFLLVILLGATLLTLPVSSAEGNVTPFFKSLFTATSATCVTGLVVYDTFTHWSTFGQCVIMVLIQIGGLGFMTLAGLFSIVLRRSVSYKERMLMAQSLSISDMSDIMKMIKLILVGTFSIEGAAAVVLSLRFIPDFGVAGGIGRGIFTSVSAFCNAGFDLMGRDAPFSSLTAYSDDLVVNLTVMALIVVGGLGFFVWSDIYYHHKLRELSVFSKIVLAYTAFLILFGAVCLFCAEFSNPDTLGQVSVKEKVLASFFQSVTARTAGFNTMDLCAMTDGSKVIMIMLMLVGGASGSTAGGLKVGTVAVISLAVWSAIRGRTEVNVMKRNIPRTTILQAFALACVSFALVIVSALIISSVDGLPFMDCIFETVSAFCTVGVTTGITTTLSTPSLTVIMLLMYLGRVGLMTVTFALFTRTEDASNRIRYPECKIIVG